MGYPGPGSNHLVSECCRGTAGRPLGGRGRGGGVLRKRAATGETKRPARACAPLRLAARPPRPHAPRHAPRRPPRTPARGWLAQGGPGPAWHGAGTHARGRGGGGARGRGGRGAGGHALERETGQLSFFLSLSAALLRAPPRPPSSLPLTPSSLPLTPSSLPPSLSLSSPSVHLVLQGPHLLYFRSDERSGGHRSSERALKVWN